jgi:DNA-binding transcriptional LysR family regulator
MLSLTTLQTIRRLADLPHFTRLAEALSLTQPAVTQHVRSLEAHFGIALVDLVGRRVVLTDAGRFLADRAGPLLDDVAALEHDMREFAAAEAGVLRIGASDTVGNYALPALLAAFAARHPGVRVDVAVGNTTEMIDRLRAGALALALVEGDVVGDDLAIEPFADDELGLVVPAAHRFAGAASVAPSDLRDEPFVAREAGSGTRALFERALGDAQIAPRIVMALPSGEAVVRAVAAGIGIAVVSRRVSADAAAAGRVREVAISGVALRRRFRAARVARLTPAPAARAFAGVLGLDPAFTSSLPRTRSDRPAR